MQILIIEDDLHKLAVLRDFVSEIRPDASICSRMSYNSGLREAIANPPSIVVLDMSMPTFDLSAPGGGGETKTYAGVEILEELARRGIASPVVVVTQFESFGEGDSRKTLEQLCSELRSRFGSVFVDAIFYDPAQSDWRTRLAAALGSPIP